MMLSRLAQARERGLSVCPIVSRGPGTHGSGDNMRLFLVSTEFMSPQPTV